MRRPACASTQSDQRLCYPLTAKFKVIFGMSDILGVKTVGGGAEPMQQEEMRVPPSSPTVFKTHSLSSSMGCFFN